jgi:hypothetical protein
MPRPIWETFANIVTNAIGRNTAMTNDQSEAIREYISTRLPARTVVDLFQVLSGLNTTLHHVMLMDSLNAMVVLYAVPSAYSDQHMVIINDLRGLLDIGPSWYPGGSVVCRDTTEYLTGVRDLEEMIGFALDTRAALVNQLIAFVDDIHEGAMAEVGLVNNLPHLQVIDDDADTISIASVDPPPLRLEIAPHHGN